VKLAMSLDGRTALANGESKWITGEPARADVQHWRARSSAILTGSGTVLSDNPRLTVRLDEHHPHPNPPLEGEGFKPLRVVLDSALRMPRGMHVLNDESPTLILHAGFAKASDDRFARAELAFVATDPNGWLDLAVVLELLANRGVNELQVEAGPKLCGALFAAGLVDELLLYIAPILLGDHARPLLNLPALDSMNAAHRLRVIDQRNLGNDFRLLLRE
jgi:diaminohydroxyphosphoribosylaminopyrimidine deaminase/5-amino-6-(5-phosphoribosylamino)uracil reductase